MNLTPGTGRGAFTARLALVLCLAVAFIAIPAVALAAPVAATAATYTVTATSGAGGSIAPDGVIDVASGASSPLFVFQADEGYYLLDVVVDGVSLGELSTFQFVNVTADHTISAVFMAESFTITATAGPGGGISPSGAQVVDNGADISFAITPSSGYHISGVLVDGVSVGAVSSYTFDDVLANHTIAASFAIDPYIITASAGSGGAISPAGAVPVLPGASSPLLLITADDGYHIADVLVDGVSMGAASSFQFVNVTDDHTIAASFALDVFTITATAGAGGSISPAGAQSVAFDADLTFTITAAAGFHIDDVTVDGASVGAVGSYSFDDVDADHSIAASFEADPVVTYTITATSGAGGSISPSGARTVTSGASAFFAFTANSGYHVADVLVDGASVGALNTYTFVNVTAGHTIAVSFAADPVITYTCTASSGPGGVISPVGAQSVVAGASSPLYALTANEGYHVSDVVIDGVSLGAMGSFQFTNVTGNHTIAVAFALDTFTITASAGEDGSISPSGVQVVDASADRVFTMTPDDGFHIADVVVDGASVGAVGSYTFAGVVADHTISASFAIDTYTITATAGANGSISPSGARTVDSGADAFFSIAPAAGYHIADVLVDGVSVGAIGNYEFDDVEANHTIAASFAINVVTTYTVTASAGANGSISPSGAQSVVSGGSSPMFVIAPSVGYHIADVLIDGVSLGAMGSYTFTNVTANHTIAASFAVDTFVVTASAGAGGAISPSGAQSVASGANAAFTITPSAGFHISDVLIDGVSAGAVGSYTFSGVVADHSISAAFAADPVITYTITASAGAGGSISPSGARSVDAGSDAVFTITAGSGYHVEDVVVDGASVGAVGSYTFADVAADHTIAAVFALTGKTPTSITIKTTRTAASIGQVFVLSGLVRPTPDMVGTNVVAYVKKPGRAYWTYSSARTTYIGPSGTAEWWYRYTLVRGMVRGTYLFKGVVPEDATYATSESGIVSVLVR